MVDLIRIVRVEVVTVVRNELFELETVGFTDD